MIDRGWVAIGTGGGAQARVLRSSDFGLTWLAETVPIAAGAQSRGVFSLTPAAHGGGIDWVAVGGDHEAPADTARNRSASRGGRRRIVVDSRGAAAFRLRSSIERLDRGALIATGPNGTDLSADDGASWTPHGATGYHAVRRARSGSLVLFAGERPHRTAATLEPAAKPRRSDAGGGKLGVRLLRRVAGVAVGRGRLADLDRLRFLHLREELPDRRPALVWTARSSRPRPGARSASSPTAARAISTRALR